MGLLENIQRQEEQQRSITEMLESLISQGEADAQQIVKLTSAVTNLTGFVKVMDEVTNERLDQLLTSLQHELPSRHEFNAMRNEQSEIAKTFEAYMLRLSNDEVVKLSDGSSITQADVAAYKMMQTITQNITTMTTASDNLADAVRKQGHVRIDTSKISEHAVNVLDKRLARAVQPSVERVVKTFEDLEALYEQMGTAKLEAITDAALEVEKASQRAERRIEQLSGKLTWTVLGRMSQVLLPYALAFIILGSLVGGFTQMLGLGPLFTWAWDSFAAAGPWWAKSLIALGTLSGVSAFVWMLYWFGKKLYESYRGW